MIMKIAEKDPSRILQLLADTDEYVNMKADISYL